MRYCANSSLFERYAYWDKTYFFISGSFSWELSALLSWELTISLASELFFPENMDAKKGEPKSPRNSAQGKDCMEAQFLRPLSTVQQAQSN